MKFAHINVNKPLILAPMEDVTDETFRHICKKHGADIVYTEFAACEAIIRHSKKTLEKIKINNEERPVAIQIFGAKPESIQKAIEIIEPFKPDFIDINCGCPVKKVVQRGEGAGLLKDLKHLEKVLKTAVNSTHLPITMKTRLGWDHKSINILEQSKIAESVGIQMMAIHCRTREQLYRGLSDWSYVEQVKNKISIPVVGNGDIRSVMDVQRMFETGADGAMIGRTALSNPMIFQNAKYYLKHKKTLKTMTTKDRIDCCLYHFKTITNNKGEHGLYQFRKFYGQYLKGIPYISEYKQKLVVEKNSKKIIQLLEEIKNTHKN